MPLSWITSFQIITLTLIFQEVLDLYRAFGTGKVAKCLNARFPSRGSPGLGPFLSFSGSSWIMGSAGQLWPVAQKKRLDFWIATKMVPVSWNIHLSSIELSYPHEKIETCRTFLKHDLPRFLAAQFLSKINGAKQKIAAGCFTFVAHHSISGY